MCDDVINLWSEDSDFNVVQTWLVGGTGGQTYSILDRFLPRIKIDEEKYDYDFGDIETEVDEIIGYKHDYKLDDPDLIPRTWAIVDGLNAFVGEVNAHPEKFFALTRMEMARTETCRNCAHRFACETNKPDFCMTGCCGAFDKQKQ